MRSGFGAPSETRVGAAGAAAGAGALGALITEEIDANRKSNQGEYQIEIMSSTLSHIPIEIIECILASQTDDSKQHREQQQSDTRMEAERFDT